jgi:hypothetical protein
MAAATLAGSVCAQQPDFGLPMPVRDAAEVQALANDFTFVRIAYSSPSPTSPAARAAAPGEDANALRAGSWATDYPEAEFQFSRQVEERLRLTAADSKILTLTDPTLSQYPMIYLVEGGRMRLGGEEVATLRDYLVGGGFLVVDDFWGAEEWVALVAELRRVFPDRPIIDLPADHDVFSAFYPISSRPAVPGFVEFRSGRAAAEPRYRGILADDGRLMAILLFNMDFGDAWEHIDDPDYPVESSRSAVAMGINSLVYALMN